MVIARLLGLVLLASTLCCVLGTATPYPVAGFLPCDESPWHVRGLALNASLPFNSTAIFNQSVVFNLQLQTDVKLGSLSLIVNASHDTTPLLMVTYDMCALPDVDCPLSVGTYSMNLPSIVIPFPASCIQAKSEFRRSKIQ